MSTFLTRPYISGDDEMRKCYAKGSYVKTSWYEGDGDGFVTQSSKRPLHVPHILHNSLTWVNENRAITIVPATMQNRVNIDGVECELEVDANLIFSTMKIDGQWYIVRFESICQQDILYPVAPNSNFSIDADIYLNIEKAMLVCHIQ